jgi:hypothetical protein
MMRKTILSGGLLATVLCVVGCGGSASLTPFEEELTQARTNWASQNLRSYKFTLRKSCFCPGELTRPATITVRNGVAIDAPEHLTAYSTIDKVLAAIEEAQKSKPDLIEVNYTADGWPSTFHVDPSAALADEEYYITISDLASL